MAELDDFSPDSCVSDETVSVDMCDYGYVDECNDKKKLQGILNLLKSGKEGHYPELVKHTEDKLLTLMTPAEQLKILRLKKEITPMERIEAETGLSAWESSILNADKSLTKKQGQTQDDIKSMNLHSLPVATSLKNLPPVRGASTPVSTSSKEVNNTQTGSSAECEGVVNRMRLAEREKLKGNEFYRVGEVEEAVRCYTRSINYDPSNHILYANRAMGYIKLEALEKAEEDCSKALQLDCTYVKAWSRRGLTRFKRGKYSLSASDFTNALKLDPANKDIPLLLQKSKDKYMEVEGKGEWREDDLINKSVRTCPSQSPCPVFTTVHNTAVSGEEFHSFLPPEGQWECVTHGTFERRNNLEVPATESVFARIPITFDDDDDEDEDEEVQGKIEEEEVIVTNSSSRNVQKSSDDGAFSKRKAAVAVVEKEKEKGNEKEIEEDEIVYTRITITDDDEEEEEENEIIEAVEDDRVEIKTESRQRNGGADSLGVEVEGVMPGNIHSATVDTTKGTKRLENQVVADDQFTRIAIADDEEEEDVPVDVPVPGAPQHSSETQEGVARTSQQGHPVTAALSVAKKESEVVTATAALSGRTLLTENDEKRKVVVGSNGEQRKKKEVEREEGGGAAEERGGGGSRDSESLKAAGNDAMKALDYKSALELYTASLNLDQSNLLTRNNRAQTHLKLLNFKEAVTDATYVIEKDPSYPLGGVGGLPSGFSPFSVSSAVKKALFRRATAYTSLGGDLLLPALKDLDQLLSFEPGNTVAHAERTKVAVLVREYEAKKGTNMDVIKGANKKGPKAGTGAGSLGPSALNGTKSSGSAAGSGQGSGSGLGLGLGGSSKGGEMMAERSSRRIAASSRDPTHPSDLPPAPPLSSTQAPLTVPPVLPPPASTAVTSTASAPVKKPFKREPSVPSEVPKTLYEFERAWRGLKDRPDLFAQYLRQNIREKSVVRKVFKESISPDLLSAVFISLSDHCTAVFSYSFLLSLSTVRHFSMTLALLQEDDLQCVRAILSKECVTDASIDGEEVRESIAQLKLLYKI